MHAVYRIFPLLLVGLTTSHSSNAHNQAPAFKGPYLGQPSPGLTPRAFAPGVIATDTHLETEVLFLPDMTELTFTRSGGEYGQSTRLAMQYKNDTWHWKSIPAGKTNAYQSRFSPPVSEIKKFAPFKDIPVIGYTRSAADTIYFYVLNFDDGSGHLSYSRKINGRYETPVKMSNTVNKGKYIAHPFIAPDESYLMWDAEKDGENTPDIFISFRQPDGSWGEAINMGDKINTPLYEQRPKVTPDGKYLFFWRGDVKTEQDGSRYVVGSPYWVDAHIIEQLRPKL
ncbi:hypothetical protein CWB99_20720 [Pseudoalteromonas rubra]|uniref:WD40-like Beta Propeller Repeat n=1 Tax=Pseudoalteromonas rubra TaxID=43658 RepID=A0A5S3WHB7_9GAMM|nr:hypothetical protein [Pseudoalteromonas rubra]TMP25597.1 hypothetical protein CWB99_20720 [Pseudoalteromonas rubra]TMP30990.1 hypothetical protein CWC00_15415 [Pseudoalteromonas rubra]